MQSLFFYKKYFLKLQKELLNKNKHCLYRRYYRYKFETILKKYYVTFPY